MADSPKVWVPHDASGYHLANALPHDTDQTLLTIHPADGEPIYHIKKANAFPVNPPNQDGSPDNTNLMYLGEPHMLHNLSVRFKNKKVYTYTAHILIACNPFESLDIYGEEIMNDYSGKALGAMAPHVYAVADRAFRSLTHYGLSQAVIVSGESGSGKTETAKIVMAYLSWAGRRSIDGGNVARLSKAILRANPILESLGNARTVRNDNSSRFGKFTKILFGPGGAIVGASISTYLLEKSRLPSHAVGERSYHIFYEMCAGMRKEQRTSIDLADASDYPYLSCAGEKPRKTDEAKDSSNFALLMDALGVCGLGETVSELFQLFAALLHLSRISFAADGDEGALLSGPDSFCARDSAAKLFGLDAAELEKVLTSRTLVTGRGAAGEIYSVPLTPTQATSSRDAIAKAVYAKLFHHIVGRINTTLSSVEGDAQEANTGKASNSFIGILDIYGFEVFETNSFEQLCINFANEKLQQHFIVHTFEREQDLYRNEGIQWQAIPYADNRDCLNLLEGKPSGLFATLDDVCRMPKASDGLYINRIYSEHGNNAAKRLQEPRAGKAGGQKTYSSKEAFVVVHFAGSVCYAIKGFVEKNTDALSADCELTLTSATHPLMLACFGSESGYNGSNLDQDAESNTAKSRKGTSRKGGRKASTISSSYMTQMAALETDLHACAPHFIRCVKTNRLSQPRDFDGAYVLSQLRCSGMMEALELMQAGYPTRCAYKELASRYRPLMPPVVARLADQTFVEAILSALEMEKAQYRLGITRVFFRAGQLAFFEKLTGQGDLPPEEIAERVSAWLIARRKRIVRLGILTHLVFTRQLRLIRLARAVQRGACFLLTLRAWSQRAVTSRARRAASKIQAMVRCIAAAHHFKYMKRSAIIIQKFALGYTARKRHGRTLAIARRRRAAAAAAREENDRLTARHSVMYLSGSTDLLPAVPAAPGASAAGVQRTPSKQRASVYSGTPMASSMTPRVLTNSMDIDLANKLLGQATTQTKSIDGLTERLSNIEKLLGMQSTSGRSSFNWFGLASSNKDVSAQENVASAQSDISIAPVTPTGDSVEKSAGKPRSRGGESMDARLRSAQTGSFSAGLDGRGGRIEAMLTEMLEVQKQHTIQINEVCEAVDADPVEQFEALQAENEELKQSMVELKVEAAERAIEAEEFAGRVEELEPALSHAKEELSKVKGDLSELSRQKVELQLEIENLKLLAAGLQERVAEVTAERDEMSSQLDAKEEELGLLARSAQDMLQLGLVQNSVNSRRASLEGGEGGGALEGTALKSPMSKGSSESRASTPDAAPPSTAGRVRQSTRSWPWTSKS